jgi:phage terminase large subunit-like protein
MLDLSRRDWEQRLRGDLSLVPEAAKGINPDEYKRAVAIFNKLRLPDVPGMPAMADAAGEWFREIVGTMLGSIDPLTGARMIRELFLLAAKKSSKTSNGAGLMLTALLMNARPRAEFLFIGPTRVVSDLAFSQAAGMIAADPDGFLQKRLHVQEHLNQITDRRTRARLLIKSFDPSVLTGVKPAGVLIDELHEISRNAKAAKIIGQLRGGLLPIPEAFLAFITTQSDDPPAGAFRSELQMARAIRDGVSPGAMMPILYEFPVAMQKDRGDPPAWQDPANWWMVTPNRGRSITVERLIPDFETAKIKGEQELRRWASQHLNLEIGLGLHTDRWAGADLWEQCGEPGLTLEALLERCDVVVIGIDGGGLDDLLGVAVLGRVVTPQGDRWLLWTRAWGHKIVLERRKGEAAKLHDLEAAGDLALVETMGDDVEQLADVVEQVHASGKLPTHSGIGLDPMGVGQIIDAMRERGIQNDPDQKPLIIAISQGWKLSGAIKTTERALADGTLRHAAQPLMAWCVGNAKVEPRGNAITITKQTAGAGKIDALMATFTAVACMSMKPQPREFQMFFVGGPTAPSDPNKPAPKHEGASPGLFIIA